MKNDQIMKYLLQRIGFVAGLCLLTFGTTMAQSASERTRQSFVPQYIVGVNFRPEWQLCHHDKWIGAAQPDSRFSPTPGLSFEARITRHSGIETGFYYRSLASEAGVSMDGMSIPRPEGHRRYFAVPLLYKYYSRIVNVGVGVNCDFLFEKSHADWTGYGRHRVGILMKVSKDITLYKGLFVEPEFHFNPFWENGELNHSWIGLQLGIKYRF